MFRSLCWASVVVFFATPAWAADGSKWTVKAVPSEPPKEVAEPIRQLLGANALQVNDGDGKVVCEIWLRKELPVKATPDEVEKGVTYRKVEQTTVTGAVRFSQAWVDFRKQNVKPGVYTLRLGYQPEDGNHQGTAPYGDFLLLTPAAEDKKADLMPIKALLELSRKTTEDGDHPSVMLLVPNAKPEDEPKVIGVKAHKLWMVSVKEPIAAGAKKGTLGVGLTVFGVTMAD